MLAKENYNNCKSAALVFRAINNEFRQEILDYLKNNGAQTVVALFIALRVEQSVMSQHLRILRQQSIVTTKRKGKFVYYKVNEQQLEKIQVLANSLVALQPKEEE